MPSSRCYGTLASSTRGVAPPMAGYVLPGSEHGRQQGSKAIGKGKGKGRGQLTHSQSSVDPSTSVETRVMSTPVPATHTPTLSLASGDLSSGHPGGASRRGKQAGQPGWGGDQTAMRRATREGNQDWQSGGHSWAIICDEACKSLRGRSWGYSWGHSRRFDPGGPSWVHRRVNHCTPPFLKPHFSRFFWEEDFLT